MPNYVTKSLQKFHYPAPRQSQYAPHQWTRPYYDTTKQLTTPLDTSTRIPRGTKAQDQKNSGHLPILCLNCGLHYDFSPQLNSRATGKPNL